jgi:hypothetical protein
MATTDDPIISQFLSGRAEGPIGMDEMADDDHYPVSRPPRGGGVATPGPAGR